MPHLKINSYYGRDPLKSHQPMHCLHLPNSTQLLTIGSNGECVMWQTPTSPLFTMIPSLNQSAGVIVCYGLVNTSNLINENSLKLLTIGEANRLRLWKLDDGICVNITGFDCFEEKIVGCCSDIRETRFIFLHSDYSLYVFDCWKMVVVSRVKLDVRIVKLYRQLIGGNEVVVIRDGLKKFHVWNENEILKDKWMDFRNIIGSSSKTEEQLKAVEAELKDHTTLSDVDGSFCKEIPVEDPRALEEVKQYLTQLSKLDINDLFHSEYLAKFPEMSKLVNPEEEITQSCMVFLNHSTPYFFIGCRSGRLYALPLFYDIRKTKGVIMIDNSLDPTSVGSQIKFITTKKNNLFVSYRSGLYRVYSLEMMELAIQSELKQKKEEYKMEVMSIMLQRFHSMDGKLSAPIKYMLQTHRMPSPYIADPALLPSVDLFSSFQLNNKQVIVINTREKQLLNFKGTPRDSKVYGVLLFDYYFGVVTQSGINIYRHDCSYERTIKYDSWQWRDYGLHKKTDIESYYNNHKSFRNSSQNSYLVNFTNRYLTHTLNYFDPRYGIVYETFGPLDENAIDNEHYLQFYFNSKAYCQSIIHSRNLTSVMSILKLRVDKDRQQSWSNTSFILHTDVKRQVEKLFAEPNESEEKDACETLNSFSLIFPWEIDEDLNKSLYPYIGYNKPALKHLLCFQGIGTSFTVYLQPAMNLRTSPFLTSYNALSIMLYFITICSKNNSITDLMLECVKYFTVKKPPLNKSLSLTQLAQLSIEGNNNVINAGCNLMMSAMLGRDIDLSRFEEYFILNLKYLEENRSKMLSSIEIYWMLVMGFAYIYSSGLAGSQKNEMLINRLISAIDLSNFEHAPELMAINLKIFNEGIEKWKPLIEPAKAYNILNTLFTIFFFYDGLANLPREERKINLNLDMSDPLLNKRMKQIIIKTVVNIANQYTNQFLQILKKQSVNQEMHPLFPCSVVEILRQYLKIQKPTRHLVFYIELLLKCISPTTPQLRKHVQKNVTQTLYFLCNYKNISFNQPSQKIALLSVNHLFIYDLRTATKWRTIDIENTEGIEHIVCMSPKGNYIAVLGRSLKIWRLSSSFWSGVLGAFSQGWNFEATGKAIKWEQSEASVTVEAFNPNNNKVFNL